MRVCEVYVGDFVKNTRRDWWNECPQYRKAILRCQATSQVSLRAVVFEDVPSEFAWENMWPDQKAFVKRLSSARPCE